MALIICKECGNQISDKAAFCPHCGDTAAAPQSSQPNANGSAVQSCPPTVQNVQMYPAKKKSSAGKIVAIIIVILVVLFSVLFATVVPLINNYSDEARRLQSNDNGNATAYQNNNGEIYTNFL